ncbi:hypothetical protein V6N13_025730 [Hibiscus sabdariffa]|uniref:RNase H type-1 domain-containing protein n=1 Tax=Hibiscus sabdariffa TaxID=183260 RepID=A0ABR2CAC0_9ROSI
MLKCLLTVGIKWEHPPSGWLKLDTDGSAPVNTGRTGAGVLIRNNPIPGEWMMGWDGSLSIHSPDYQRASRVVGSK